MIPQHIIDNEDPRALDAIAAEYKLELDHRKKFMNQVSDVKARIHATQLEEKRREEEALKDPRNWEWRDGFKLHAKFGVHPNGGVYLIDPITRLEFFVPQSEVANYRTK
jgi:hypothetical protein